MTALGATIVQLSEDRRWDGRPEDRKVGFSAGSPVVEFELGLARSESDELEECWTNLEDLLECVHGCIGSSVVNPAAVG